MTLSIELSDSKEAALKSKTDAEGVSVEGYAKQVLNRHLNHETIESEIQEIWKDMPAEVRAKLPPDGADQIDHYIYGLPRGLGESGFCRYVSLGGYLRSLKGVV